MPRRRKDFSTAKVHPRTLAEVVNGSAVITRNARGELNSQVATTSVTPGMDFMVVWVSRTEEFHAAIHEKREPDAVPWPAEDVWVPGCEPREGSDHA